MFLDNQLFVNLLVEVSLSINLHHIEALIDSYLYFKTKQPQNISRAVLLFAFKQSDYSGLTSSQMLSSVSLSKNLAFSITGVKLAVSPIWNLCSGSVTATTD